MTKHRATISVSVAALMLAGPVYPQSRSPTDSPPVVSTVSPDHAPNSGVSGVVITGLNFTGATQVLFGPNAASFTVDNDTQITANLGAVSTTGFVDVSVTNPCGTGTLAHGFDYFTPPQRFGYPCDTTITWSGSPTLGQNYTVTVHPPSAAFSWGAGRLFVSWSNRRHAYRPNWCQVSSCCGVYVFVPDYHVPLAGSPLSYTFAIPNNISLIGVNLKTQGRLHWSSRGCCPVYSQLDVTEALSAVIGE